MPVRIQCPHCGGASRLPEELYEGPVQCPLCDGAIALRWHPRGARQADAEDIPTVRPVQEPARRCPFCGAALTQSAARCGRCGERLEG